MSKLFYGKLAVGNLKKNKSIYLPYILTAVGMSAVFYIMIAITGDPGINQMAGAAELRMILGLGCGVVGIFATIFLFYTNSFLMKRRKREFGLFNILGMEKRHIGKMMFWETLMVAVISIIGGLLAGVILNKLMVLLLLRLTRLDVPFGFYVSLDGLRITGTLFAVIFAVTLLFNLHQVQKAKPIELLRSSSQGEAEPKTRWLLTIIGGAALAGGYYIAIMTKDPMGALMLFFVAVILVMIGTYCLFTSGSIAVLKLLRRNKNYYYKTSHFTSVSGMIYRMKQNAVGLANICILSTAVLVMISGTVSLYSGMTEIIDNRYPKDISIASRHLTDENKEALNSLVARALEENSIKEEQRVSYEMLSVTALKVGKELKMEVTNYEEGNLITVSFLTMEQFEALGGIKEELKDNEVLVYAYRGNAVEPKWIIGGKEYQIKKHISKEESGELNTGLATVSIYDSYFLIVKDNQAMEEIEQIQQEAYQDRASMLEYYTYLDVSGTEKQEIACTERINQLFSEYSAQNIPQDSAVWMGRADSKAQNKSEAYVFYGGFLFLGIFLGFVFLLATVLIIYYKQISEGYEDKGRFEIMQKVGMNHKEVKASIRSQILKVFFLPLIMAGIHLAAAFPLINRLLALFAMKNTALFAVCSVITVVVFAVIYGIVYGITARTYYKIIES